MAMASHPFDDAIIHPFLFLLPIRPLHHLLRPSPSRPLPPPLPHPPRLRSRARRPTCPPPRLKYTYESESAGRKIKCTTHHRPHGDRTINDDGFDRNCKWESKTKLKYAKEVKGKGWLHPCSHAYSVEEVFGGDDDEDHHHKADKKVNSKDYAIANKEEHKKNSYSSAGVHIVEIDDNTAGCVAIKKAFASTYGKGKRKELSPLDAALLIQMNYRAHLAHRSQVLRCLRDLALKEIRSLFYNISYRRRIAHDTEERQRFAEKIIVLLLTVDALEGPDYMVRNAKRSMLEELEGMLEIVDPQPPGKPRTLSRRKFDLPEGRAISSEMRSGVKNVVKIVEEGKYHNVNINVSARTDDGLFVPVIRSTNYHFLDNGKNFINE
uniref:BAG domain-containing protein n=1 Tax=Leersia perrieri TaxID=77586 RepID=A0A0D9VB49_9ORYZ